MDNLTPEQRSHTMAVIRAKDTKPELIVRSMVHRMGFRFRLHERTLPGRPDLVLPRHRKVVFVHGCFWHLHRCRWGQVVVKSNCDYWAEKRSMNRVRDQRTNRLLRSQGWSVLTVWECWTRDLESLERRLLAFLTR